MGVVLVNSCDTLNFPSPRYIYDWHCVAALKSLQQIFFKQEPSLRLGHDKLRLGQPPLSTYILSLVFYMPVCFLFSSFRLHLSFVHVVQ